MAYTTPYTKDALRQLASDAAARYGLPYPLFSSLIQHESGWNPRAKSPKNAMGLTQMIPSTAKRFGVDDPYDPAQSLEGGAKYLRWLLDRYNGDARLAVAGYNAGEGNVDKHRGVPPFPETQAYVRNVLNTAMAGGPSNAGMPVPAVPPQALPPRMDAPPPPLDQQPAGSIANVGIPKEAGMTMQVSMEPSVLENPWLQVGLGILGSPSGEGGPVAATARGISAGLSGVEQARLNRILREQKGMDQALYTKQLVLQQAALLGGGALTPQDRLQATGTPKTYLKSDGSTVVAWFDRATRTFYDTAGRPVSDVVAEAQTTPTAQRPVTPRPYGVTYPDGSTGTIDLSKQPIPEGATLTQLPAGGGGKSNQKLVQVNYGDGRKPETRWVSPGEDPPAGASFSGLPTAPKVTPDVPKEIAGQPTPAVDAAIDNLGSVIERSRNNPSVMRQLGLPGVIGSKVAAVTGTIDSILPTNLDGLLSQFYGGENPATARIKLKQNIQQIARMLVEAKGPLAKQEQDRAAELVGLSEDQLQSPAQAFQMLQETHRMALKLRAYASQADDKWWAENGDKLAKYGVARQAWQPAPPGSTPPVLQATPPQAAPPQAASGEGDRFEVIK